MKTAKTWFAVTTVTAIGLFVTGFIIPPSGVIDGSVLTAGGLLLGFAALAEVPMLVKRGADVNLQVGQANLSINNPDNVPEEGGEA